MTQPQAIPLDPVSLPHAQQGPRVKHYLIAFAMLLQAGAVLAAEKHPLDYPLKEYAFLLMLALLGGLVSWVQKVRAGTIHAWNLMSLIGELATSAFAGLITFFVCSYMDMPAPLTAAIVGVSGHMGVRAIGILERIAEKKLGVPPDHKNDH